MRKEQLKKTLKRMIEYHKETIEDLADSENSQTKAITLRYRTRLELLEDLVLHLEGNRVALSFYMGE